MLCPLMAAVAVSLLGVQPGSGVARHDPDAQDLVQLGCNTYVDNVERLEFLTCQFHYLIDSPGAEHRRVEGLWIKDDALTKFQMGCDEKYIEKRLNEEMLKQKGSARPQGKGTIQFDCPLPHAVLLDGDKSADHGPVIAGLAIRITPMQLIYQMDTPLHMRVMGATGNWNPGQLLKDCLSGRRVARLAERREQGGHTLLKFVIGDRDDRVEGGASPRIFKFHLDLERGCLPVSMSCEIRDAAGSSKVEFELTTDEFYELPGGRWFPKHSIVTRGPRETGKGQIKEEWFVTRIDAATRPVIADFTLDIPDGTQVHAPPLIGAAFATRGRRAINVRDIDMLYQECLRAKEAAEQRRLNRRSTSSAKRHALPAIIWFNIVVILILGIGYTRKRLRVSPRSEGGT